MNIDVTVRRESARYLAKKDRILTAATEVLNDHGVSGFTLILVAERLGVHPASLAYYYRKKEELIAACRLATFSRFHHMIDDAQAAPDARGRVARFIHNYFDVRRRIFLGDEPALANFNEVTFISQPYSRQLGAAYRTMFDRIAGLFIEKGEDHTLQMVKRGLWTRLVIEQLMRSATWLRPVAPEEFERTAGSMIDILFGGLVADRADWPRRLFINPTELTMVADAGTQRGAFLRAATQLINEQGYRGASVDKISARLNVTKGAFYYHNADKDELVMSCFDRTFRLMDEVQRKAAAAETGWQRVCIASATMADFHNSPAGPLIRQYAISALPPALRQDVRDRSAQSAHRFASFISEGIRDGSVRQVDPLIAGQMVMAVINSSTYLGGHGHSGVPGDQVVEAYVRPALIGLFR